MPQMNWSSYGGAAAMGALSVFVAQRPPVLQQVGPNDLVAALAVIAADAFFAKDAREPWRSVLDGAALYGVGAVAARLMSTAPTSQPAPTPQPAPATRQPIIDYQVIPATAPAPIGPPPISTVEI